MCSCTKAYTSVTFIRNGRHGFESKLEGGLPAVAVEIHMHDAVY